MKKLFVAALLAAALLAHAAVPCARYTVTPEPGTVCSLNNRQLTVGVPASFNSGDVLYTSWANGCAYGNQETTTLKGYVWNIPSQVWVQTSIKHTFLLTECESVAFTLTGSVDPNCQNAQVNFAQIPGTMYCPCQE